MMHTYHVFHFTVSMTWVAPSSALCYILTWKVKFKNRSKKLTKRIEFNNVTELIYEHNNLSKGTSCLTSSYYYYFPVSMTSLQKCLHSLEITLLSLFHDGNMLFFFFT